MTRHHRLTSSATSLTTSFRAEYTTSTKSSSYSFTSSDFAEVAGGTAAECAAVCCCCPCGLANLLYVTVYKLPAGICRNAWRRNRRKQLTKKGLFPARSKRCKCGCDDTELQIHRYATLHDSSEMKIMEEVKAVRSAEEMVRLEKEMLEIFYGTGFWRSPSQRESLPPSPPPSVPKLPALTMSN